MEQETKEKGKFISFIALVTFLLGVVCGLWAATHFYTNKMNESIEMKRFIHNKVIYDIQLYDKTGK